MPSEFRRLLFSKQEVVEALTAHSARLNKPLPAGSVIKCELIAEPEFAVQLTVQNNYEGRADTGKRYEVSLAAPVVGAALLQFCIEKKIPMPKSAKKALQITGDGLVMTITL